MEPDGEQVYLEYRRCPNCLVPFLRMTAKGGASDGAQIETHLTPKATVELTAFLVASVLASGNSDALAKEVRERYGLGFGS